MRFRSALLLSLGALLAASNIGASGEDASRAVRCPAYAEHVRAAKTYLEHADRANASAELRLAEDALRECELDEEEETVLAAWTRPTPAAGDSPRVAWREMEEGPAGI